MGRVIGRITPTSQVNVPHEARGRMSSYVQMIKNVVSFCLAARYIICAMRRKVAQISWYIILGY